jgi:hypothetical protein
MTELIAKIILAIIEAYNKLGLKISLKKFIIFFSTLVVLLIVGFFIYQSNTKSTISIEITYPTDKDSVSIIETIKGKSENIPVDKSLWIVVSSFSPEIYFPKHSPVQINPNGEWSTVDTIGSSADLGKYFYISAYLLDNLAVKDLERSFSQPVFAGLVKMPQGSVSYYKIIVKRKIKE